MSPLRRSIQLVGTAQTKHTRYQMSRYDEVHRSLYLRHGMQRRRISSHSLVWYDACGIVLKYPWDLKEGHRVPVRVLNLAEMLHQNTMYCIHKLRVRHLPFNGFTETEESLAAVTALYWTTHRCNLAGRWEHKRRNNLVILCRLRQRLGYFISVPQGKF